MASPYKEAVLATAGLVSLYPLDEASGEAIDAKSAHNGEANGGIERAQASLLPNGEGKSAKFNGTSGYFKVANHADLEIADTVSFEAWFKLSAVGALRYIVDLGGNSGQMDISLTNLPEFGKAGISEVAVSSAAVDTSAAHHMVCTKSGETRKVYVDNADLTVLKTNKIFEKSAETKTVGAYHTGALAFFAGNLQYVSVYNVALSQATVEAHYAAGSQSTSPGSQFPLSRRNRTVTS